MKQQIIYMIELGFKLKNRIVGHEVTARSAQMTYYWILAIFPFLITIMSIISYINLNYMELLKYVELVIPSTIMPFVNTTLQQVIEYRSATVLSFGAIASIWSASAAVSAMTKGIHKAYNVIDLRPYWIRKLVALIYTVLLVVMIVSAVVLLIYGNIIGSWFFNTFMPDNAVYYIKIWDNLRLTTPVIGLLIGMYLIYRYIPRKHLRYMAVWPGTVFTSVSWYGFSVIFSIYADKFSKYNQMYGSIGSVFILLVWLYVTNILILVGAEINAFYQDTIKTRKNKIMHQKRRIDKKVE